MKRIIVSCVLVMTLMFGLVACGGNSNKETTTTTTQPQNTAPGLTLGELAKQDKDFSNLMQYLEAAKLTYLLNNRGTFTVFAPTDAAFSKIDPATIEKIKADNVTLLKILMYHAVVRKIRIEDLVEGQKLVTVGGGTLTVGKQDGKFTLTTDSGEVATITESNIIASNGIIHKIDTVLMPPDLDLTK